jgi:hypothetical protein
VAELLVSFAVAMTAVPLVNSHELVEHPAPVLLGGRGVLPGVFLGDLFARCHRQPLTHPPSTLQRPRQDPGFASPSPVRHEPHLSINFGRCRRAIAEYIEAFYNCARFPCRLQKTP